MTKVTTWLAVLLSSSFLATNLQAETAAAKAAPKPEKVLQLTADLQDEIFAVGVAMQVVQYCGRIYTLDVADLQVLDSDIEQTLLKQGFADASPAVVDAAMSQSNIRAKAQSYFNRRNLRENSGSSWCPVGQAEIAQKTRIGKYLVKK